MESKSADEDSREESAEQRAADQTPTPSTSLSPRRGLRARRVGRPRSGGVPAAAAPPPPEDTNGAAAAPGARSSRVLRDRSTRSVPAWLKESRSEEEEDEAAAPVRRKVSSSRRRKASEAAGGCEEDAGDREWVSILLVLLGVGGYISVYCLKCTSLTMEMVSEHFWMITSIH